MALSEGQVQVRDLVMGPGTPYVVRPGFNPYARTVRADASAPRAWNHGSYSGAEWMDEAVVPIPVSARGDVRSVGSWLAVHQPLAAAFAPVGDVTEDVELRWRYGGVEYVMFGRPRLVDPATSTIAAGRAITRCGMVCQDPRIYSGSLAQGSSGLAQHEGGLTVPLTLPATVGGFLVGGRLDLLNEGTAATSLFMRIDGPVTSPRVILQRPDGSVQSVEFFDLAVPSGQWVEVNTANGTALRNGLPGSSVRGRVIWDVDPYPLLPGTTVVRFLAGEFDEAALLTTTHRSAWW